MAYTTVLFDLDGTLLPMDQDVFLTTYFKLLKEKASSVGYDAKLFMHAVFTGLDAMIKNDGKKSNEEVFWNAFTPVFGPQTDRDEKIFEDFYANEFEQVKDVCGFDIKAAEIIQLLKKKGIDAVLATNPVFPHMATESRMRWAGLSPMDFKHYTTYENSFHAKPHPDYYRDIINTLSLDPKKCLMVGNDVEEDMVAKDLGMDVFLLTDCLINKPNADISVYPHGGFDELKDYLNKMTD